MGFTATVMLATLISVSVVCASTLDLAHTQTPTANFRVTEITSGATTLNWNIISGAEYYQIERDRDDGNLLLLSADSTERTCVDYHQGSQGDELTYIFKAYDSSWNAVAERTITATVPANQLPTVNAGSDKTKYGNERIRLTTTVTDEHADRLWYEWTKTSGPNIDMSCVNCDVLSVKAPVVTAQTIFTFKVTVTDLSGDEGSDTVDLIVNPNPNTSPIADPGPDREVNELETIGLYGLGSYDPDGTIDTYAWTQARGPTIQLEDDNTATPKFTAPSVSQDTQFNYRLTVTDNDGETHSKMVRITVKDTQNKTPIADAGSDQRVMAGDTVTLDGTESYDEDNTLGGITYSWIQASGSTVTLSATDVASPTFTAPSSTNTQKLTFLLTVSDNLGGSAMDKINVVVTSIDRPRADAGETILANELGQVTLDGSGSRVDADGNASYKWEIVEATAGFPDRLNGETVTFTAPGITDDVVLVSYQLTITDNYLTSTDTVNISVMNNIPPTSEIVLSEPGGENVLSSEDVILHGFAGDLNGADTISYSFDQIKGSSVTMTETSNDKETTSETLKIVNEFTAPDVIVATDLEFRLTVVDHAGETATSEILITIVPDRNLTADAGDTVYATPGSSVMVRGSGTDDNGNNQGLEYSWASDRTDIVLTQTNKRVTFTAPNADTVFSLTLTVTDGYNAATDTIDVIVRPNDHLPVVDAGDDLRVTQGDTVRIVGSVTDQDGADTVISEWTQTRGATITIDDPTDLILEFTAPMVNSDTTLTFKLSGIDDSNVVEDSVRVVIKAENNALELLAVPDDQIAYSGNTVTLESAASDVDDDVSYAWIQTSGTDVTLTDADKRTVSFTAPDTAGDIVLRLTVSAGGETLTHDVTITVRTAPEHTVEAVQSRFNVNVGDTVRAEMIVENPDGDFLWYEWRIVDSGELNTDEIYDLELAIDGDKKRTSFTVPQVGTIVLMLVVSDGDHSDADFIYVTAN